MSLIFCPECGHEVSNTAVSCPNCGRPIAHVPGVERTVVLPPRPERDGFPTWAFIPIGVLAVVVILVIFLVFGRNSDDEANQRLHVNINAERPTTAQRSEPPVVTSVPPSSSTSSVSVPSSAPSSSLPSSQTTVPGSQTTVAPPDKGRVVIDAKVVSTSGATRAVSNEKFYLLDQDVEGILSAGGLEGINGQSLTNSLGLSLVYPDRFGDFSRSAMKLLAKHIKYSGRTDGSGKAQLTGVEPNSYYVFGMTHTAAGFAVWSSPVSVQAGDNVLDLSPQQMTQIDAG